MPLRFNLSYKDKVEKKEVTKVEKKEEVKKVEVKEEKAEEKKDDEEIPEIEKYNQFKPLKPGFGRPIIIHRAILGSLERSMAILIEHFGGKWPFFISPRQISIIPVNVAKYGSYARKIRDKLAL